MTSKARVLFLGDSYAFTTEERTLKWTIDIGTGMWDQWEQEGLPTLLRAISGWAARWGLAATILLGDPERRLWTAEERSGLDQAIAEGRGWTGP